MSTILFNSENSNNLFVKLENFKAEDKEGDEKPEDDDTDEIVWPNLK